jgi:FKBP-type peptidyl-prolyl cis-trans isomerase SlyD
MKIQDNAFVSVHYTIALDSGEIVERSDPGEPMCFLFGLGQLPLGFERNIEGMEAGQDSTFIVEPAEGYGERSEEMLMEVPLSRFPQDVEIKAGMRFQGPGGRSIGITDVNGDTVTIDANHPLAGERLHFDVKIEQVRESTEEDMEALGGCGGGCSACGHAKTCG